MANSAMPMTAQETDLDGSIVSKLSALGFELRPEIRDRAALEANFREKFEALNRVALTDGEFRRILRENISPYVYEASRSLRGWNAFVRDDGTPLDCAFVNFRDWSRNAYEIVDRPSVDSDNGTGRGVMLLINGVPVVQVELGSRGTSPRSTMERIVSRRNGHGAECAGTLTRFIQLFVVGDRENVWHFANNDDRHFAFGAEERFLPICRFADEDNRKIARFGDFAERFLAPRALGRMIGKHMVLAATERKLLMMRPHQIHAAEAIAERIDRNGGDGCVWHAPGSGKTLAAFHASRLVGTDERIRKCVFVVDRDGLDGQFRDELDLFQENCLEEKEHVETLLERLRSDEREDKVVVATGRVLEMALDGIGHPDRFDMAGGPKFHDPQIERLRDERMVFIFDDCRRSWFDEIRASIKEFFPNSQSFVFTGASNFGHDEIADRNEGDVVALRNSPDSFGYWLHAYSFAQATEDGNVLRLHVDRRRPGAEAFVDTCRDLPKRTIARAILDKHDALSGNRRFNALLAAASVDDALEYYDVLEELQAELRTADPDFVPFGIAAVFAPLTEGDEVERRIKDESAREQTETIRDSENRKAAIEAAIANYNKRHGADHDIENLDLYCRDVQRRMRDRRYPDRGLPGDAQERIDIAIVAGNSLAGFDSSSLNTLYLDKNLDLLGLIQAFARTIRPLNATKPCGHVVDFRDQRDGIDAALSLLAGVPPDRSREIVLADEAEVVIDKFRQAAHGLDAFMTSRGIKSPGQAKALADHDSRVEFIELFKDIQSLRIQLDQYAELDDEQRERIERFLPKGDFVAYRGAYLDIALSLKERKGKRGRDVRSAWPEFDRPDFDRLDFEFVLFASASIEGDHVMEMIAKLTGQDPEKARIGLERLVGRIRSDAGFLDERGDLVEYVRSIDDHGRCLDEAAVRDGYERFKTEKRSREIAELARVHGLETESLAALVETSLQRWFFDGERLADLMEPRGLGWRERRERERALMADLAPLLNRQAQGRKIAGLGAYERWSAQ